MTDRGGIFAGENPFAIAELWMGEAVAQEINDPNAAALSTVDATGMPNVRIVLLKEIETDAFVFYTNYGSAKAQELDSSGKAAMVLHWKSLRRQIRIRGLIAREDGAQADAYFASRSPASRIGAWASDQSQPIEARSLLESAVERVKAEQGEDPKRPPFWGGFRLTPLEVEFWADGAHRLHDRFQWRRDKAGSAWHVQRLNP